MTNAEAAALLEQIADLLDLQGENPFKIRAYRNAARVLEGHDVPFGRLVEAGTLGELQGIGKALEEKLGELHRRGRMTYFEELRASLPAGLPELLKVQGLGPKKVRALWKELGIESLDQLEKACRDDKVQGLNGFGAKTQAKILEGLALVRSSTGRFLLSQATVVARDLLAKLGAFHVERSAWCGSVRRGKPIVRDVDLLVSSKKPRAVIDAFAKSAGAAEILGQGDTKCSIRLESGLQVDLRVVADDEFAPALLYFTGSKEHNVLLRGRAVKLGLSLNEYALTKGKKRLATPTEESIYRHLGLNYIPPELRENRGEIELAEAGPLPRLVERGDIQGVFHVHSTWSDGTASIEDMVLKARSMGLKWMGLSDHSKAASYANGLDEARLAKQAVEIKALNRKYPDFRLFHGLECDILPTGKLDLTPKALAALDFVIGSVHSRFDMAEDAMTDRIRRAIADPNFDCLGHSTGRLLLEREGYPVDLEQVLQAAKDSGKAVEINANPHRLDLDDPHVHRARELGVKLVINPDAHSPQGLEDLEYGLLTARRGGCTREDLLNTLPADEVLDHLAAR